MDLIDRLKAIAQQVEKLRSQIQNEQATKSAFIMPFIQGWGYDVFNPMEVHPEYTADLPGLKGEKVDYAICLENQPIILIECKSCNESLEKSKHCSQLHRYFHATAAKFSVLTNGIIYRFYTDTDKDNVMDEKPFFEFNILNFDESDVNELKRFSKSNFNSSSNPTVTPSDESELIEVTTETGDKDISPTGEELESFYIMKSILRESIDTARIQYKNTKAYFGINIDGKVRQTICRIKFNDKTGYKSIAILDNLDSKKEATTTLSTLDEIYGVAEFLKARVNYLTQDSYTSQPKSSEMI